MTRHIVPDSRNTCGTARRACAGRCATPLVVTLTRLGALAAVSLAPATITAQQFVRERPPTLGAPAPLTVPAVRSARLPNGMALQVVAQRELPLVQVIVSFPGGSRLDGATPGIAAFTANMLDEGAGTRDAATLQAELAFLGAQLQTGADWDRLFVALKVPVRSLGPALDLLADVVRRPTFSAAEVRRQRDLRLANLLQQRDQPNALADLAFNAIVYPAGHPYHNSAGGDSASVAAFDSSAVRAFYTRAVRPERASAVIVGDLDASDARAQLARRLGEWAATGTAATAAPVTVAARRETSTRVYLVDKPNAAQSVITIGWPGVDRLSPDYAPLMVMNTLLGASFTSRLNMNLRETHGYTYGASSRFAFRPVPGPFVASAAVRTNVTDSSLVEFFKELRGVRDATVPDDELQRAKAYVELGLPGSLESTSQVAASIAQLATFSLPLGELSAYATRVRAVTAADVQRVARQYLTPDHATVVVVGDLSKVRPAIEALKLGELSVLEVKEIAR
ncbi:MAG: insulinase family protein [Gemmatimonadetes bacterium]|nr:insulinase family protein [Gemmatimonadota bacterium]